MTVDPSLRSYGYQPIAPQNDQPVAEKKKVPNPKSVPHADVIASLEEALQRLSLNDKAVNERVRKHSLVGTTTKQLQDTFVGKLFANIHLGSSALDTTFEGMPDSIPVKYLKELLTVLKNDGFTKVPDLIEKDLGTLFAMERNWEWGESNRETFANDIARDILKLPAGQSLLMKGGWRGHPTGHAEYYQFKKNQNKTFDIYVYNAQGGVETVQGGTIEALKTKGVPFQYYKKVLANAFLFSGDGDIAAGGFIEALLDCKYDEQEVKEGEVDPVTQIFKRLATYVSPPPKAVKLFITLQRSGNCAIHSMNAMLLSLYAQHLKDSQKGRDAYKLFVYQSKLLSLVAYFEKVQQEIKEDSHQGAQLRFQIRRAAEAFARRYLKSVQSKHIPKNLLVRGIYTSLDIIQRLDAFEDKLKVRKVKNRIPVFGVDPKIEKEHIALLKAKLTKIATKKIPSAQVVKDLSSPSIPLMKELKTVTDLLKLFFPIQIDFSWKKMDAASAIEAFVKILPFPKVGGETLWDQLELDVAYNVSEKLEIIFDAYCKEIFSKDYCYAPRVSHTLMTLLAITDHLSRCMDREDGELLKGYHIDITSFKNLIHSTPYLMESTEEMEQRSKILEYFEGVQKEKKPLFSFSHQRILNANEFQKSGEHLFYKELLKKKPQLKAYIKKNYDQYEYIYLYSRLLLDKETSIERSHLGFPLLLLSQEDKYATLLYSLFSYVVVPALHYSNHEEVSYYNRLIVVGDLFGKEQGFKRRYFPRLKKMALKARIAMGFRKGKVFKSDQDGKIFHILAIESIADECKFNLDGRWNFEHQLQTIDPFHKHLIQSDYFQREFDDSIGENKVVRGRPAPKKNDIKFDLELAGVEGKILPYTLLHHFLQHHEKLKQPKWRTNFLVMLFRPTVVDGKEIFPLRDEIATQKGFWQSCQRFISDGLKISFLAQPKQKPSLEWALFYIRLSHKLTRLYRETHGEMPTIPLIAKSQVLDVAGVDSPHSLLKNWEGDWKIAKEEAIQTKTGKEKEIDQELSLIRYHFLTELMQKSPEKYSTDGWSRLFSALVPLQRKDFLAVEDHKDFEDQHSLQEVNRFFRQAIPHFRTAFEKNKAIATPVCEAVLRTVVPGAASKQAWVCTTFPVFRRGSKEDFWEINILTGGIRSNKGVVSIPKALHFSERELERLFGERGRVLRAAGEDIYFKDPLWGQIHVVNGADHDSEQKLLRKVYHRWFTYVMPNQLDNRKMVEVNNKAFNPPILPNALIADYTHWLHQNEMTGELELRIADRVTGKDAFTFKNGKLSRVNGPEVDLTLFAELESRKVDQFEDPGFVLSIKLGPSRDRLTFTRFKSSSGKELALVNNPEKQWVLEHNPYYQLCNNLPVNPLKNYQGFLCFSNVHNPSVMKFLLPFDKLVKHQEGYLKKAEKKGFDIDSYRAGGQNGTQRFFEVDFNGKELCCDTIEGKIHLAHIFLAQKEYPLGFKFINQVREGDHLSKQSKELLERLIRSGKDLKDHSADACALRLRAYYTLLMLSPFKSTVDISQKGVHDGAELQQDPLPEAVTEIYERYLGALNNVDDFLKLSPRLELEIIGAIKKSYLIDNRNIQLAKKQEKYLRREYEVIPGKGSRIGENWLKEVLAKKPCGFFREGKFHNSEYFSDKKREYQEQLPSWVSESTSNPTPIKSQKEYPTERFWYDYRFLTGPKTHNAQKKSWLYKMERAKHCFTLDNSENDAVKFLCTAYVAGSVMPPPPADKSYENLKRWFEKVTLIVMKVWLDNTDRKSVKQESVHIKPEKISTNLPLEKGGISSTGKDIQPTAPVDLRTYDSELGLGNLQKKFLKASPSKKEAKTYSVKAFSIAEDQLTPTQKEYQDVLTKEAEDYAKDLKDGEKLNREQMSYERLKGNGLKTFVEELSDEVTRCRDIATKLENLVLKKVNRLPIEELRQRFHLAKKFGLEQKKVTLLQVLRAFAGNEKQQGANFKKLNDNLSKEQITDLKETTQHYLEVKTTLSQMERGHAVLEKMKTLEENKGSEDPLLPSLWQEAGEILAQKRQYVPRENTEALVFECLSGLRVRQEQTNIIQEVIRNLFCEKKALNQFGIVFQLIMGGGKTSVILSQLTNLAANLDKVPLFLCHHSQYASILGNLKQFQRSRFGQDVVSLDFTRNDLKDVKTLQFIQKKVMGAKKLRQVIVMKTPFLQSLALELKSLIDELRAEKKGAPAANITQRIQILATLVQFFRKEAVGLIDEVDINLSALLGVHFPRGAKKFLKKSRSELFRDLFFYMATDPEIKDLIRLKENKQNYLSEEDYRKKVLPRVAELLIKRQVNPWVSKKEPHPLRLDEGYLSSFQRYVAGNTIPPEIQKFALDEKLSGDVVELRKRIEEIHKKLPKGHHRIKDKEVFVKECLKDLQFLIFLWGDLSVSRNENRKEAAHQIALTKYLLSKIIPTALQKNHNRHFGRKEDKVIPFLGVGVPATTEFANLYEKATYHFLTAANKGVSPFQVQKIAEVLTKTANHYAKNHSNLSFDQTDEARLFHQLTNVYLHEIDQPKKLENAVDYINEDMKRRFEIEEKSAVRTVYFSPFILSSSPVDVVHLLSQAIACSGTIWNHPTYPYRLRTFKDGESSVRPTAGTEGRILDQMAREVEANRSGIFHGSEATVEAVLEQSFNKNPRRLKGIIDVAGLFKQFTNDQVAQRVLSYFHGKGGIDEIQGVVFLYKDPKTKEETYALLKKGIDSQKKLTTELIPLENSTPEEVLKHGISLRHLFFYYDELRGTGTDFKQLPDAVNVVTFDPKSTTMRSFLQATMRLRGYFAGQNADYYLHDEGLKFLPGYEEEQETKLQQMWQAAVANQAVERGKQLFRSYREQIMGLFKRRVDKRLEELAMKISEEGNVEKLRKLNSLFYEFIFTIYEDDPFAQFGSLEIKAHPKDVLKDFFKSKLSAYLAKFDTFYAGNKDREALRRTEEQEICAEAEPILGETAELKFKVQEKAGLGMEEANIEVNNEVEKEAEVEVEEEVNRECEIELNSYQVEATNPPRVETLLKFDCKGPPAAYRNLIKKPDVSSLKTVFKEGYDEVFKKIPNFNTVYLRYGSLFPETIGMTIGMTDNFRYTLDQKQKLPIFHRVQKKLTYLLVVQEEGKVRFILVSVEEATSLKGWIAANQPDDCYLINMNGDPLESRGKALPTEDPTFKRKLEKGLWFLNFFDGNTAYLTEHATETRKFLQGAEEETQELMLRYLDVRSLKNEGHHNIFKVDKLFKAKGEVLETIFFALAKRLVSPERQAEIGTLPQKKIEDLDDKEIHFLTSEQIALLPDHVLKRLPGHLVKHVPAHKVAKLNRFQLSFLTTREQITTLLTNDPLKFQHLLKEPSTVKEQLKHLPDAFYQKVDPKVIEHVPPDKVHFLGENLFQGGIWFTGEQVPDIAPKYVPRIPNNMLSACKGKAQIEKLTNAQIRYLGTGDLKQLCYLNPETQHPSKVQMKAFAHSNIEEGEWPEGWRALSKKLTSRWGKTYVSELHPSHFSVLEEDWNDVQENVKCLTDTQIGQLRKEHERLLYWVPSDKVCLLSKDELRGISDSNLESVTEAQILTFDKNDGDLVKRFTFDLNRWWCSEKYDRPSYQRFLSSLPDVCFPLLTKEQVAQIEELAYARKLTMAQVPFIAGDVVKTFDPAHAWDREAIGHLTMEQLSFLSEGTHQTWIPCLKAEQCRKLLEKGKFHPNTWDPTVIAKLTADQKPFIDKLREEKLKCHSAREAQKIRKKRVTDLKKEQIKKIPGTKFAYFTVQQLKSLFKIDRSILGRLTSEQWIRLDPADLGPLTDQEIEKVPKGHDRFLSVNQIKRKSFKFGEVVAGHVLLGLVRSVFFPVIFAVQFVVNLVIMQLFLVAALFMKSPKGKQLIKGQAGKTFLFAPTDAFLAFVQLFSPAKYQQLRSQYRIRFVMRPRYS